MPLSDDGNGDGDTLESQRERIAGLIQSGQPAAAFELSRTAIERHQDDAGLQYLHALALARGGNPRHADKVIKGVLRRPDLTAAVRTDALSLSARLYKDLYAQTHDAATRQNYARKSAELYQMAYKISGSAFPGINAATMLCISGAGPEQYRQLATEVKAAVEPDVSAATDPFWHFATLGEACLLLGEFSQQDDQTDGAEYWYRQAIATAGKKRQGDIAAMRRQVHLLQACIDLPSSLASALASGTIAVFSGHMIDRPDRISRGLAPRFPPDTDTEVAVAAAIGRVIKELDVREGFVSAACGADLLFAERLLADDCRVHIVLPFALDDFMRRSVDFGRKDDYWRSWRNRCERVLEQVGDDVHYATTERDYGGDIMFQFQNLLTQGLAIQRAERLDLEAWAVVLGDSSEPQIAGGTEDFVRHWQEKGEPFDQRLRRIDLRDLRDTGDADTADDDDTHHDADPRPPAANGGALGLFGAEHMELRSMLFADVSGFSALREDQGNIFFILFSEKVAALIDEFPHPPIFQNTWGDGLFFAFERPEDCAAFALELVEIPANTDFESLGLPADLSIRVGIHCGPVFILPDPIIKQKNNFGAHVNRAARIEPVTMPGCVYASEHMAALLAGSREADFVLEYVGVADLAKGYDRCPLYQVEKS